MPTSSSANVHLTTLKTFRQTVYASGLGHARDALFELTDAVLLAPAVNSFAELSLQPSFRRRWPMLYKALQDGIVKRDALLEIYCQQIPHTTRPLLAGDHTAWPRLHAPTLRERTVEHQPHAISLDARAVSSLSTLRTRERWLVGKQLSLPNPQWRQFLLPACFFSWIKLPTLK